MSVFRDDESDSEDDEDNNIEEEQGIDPESAFVAIAGKKISNIQTKKDDNKKYMFKGNNNEEVENQTKSKLEILFIFYFLILIALYMNFYLNYIPNKTIQYNFSDSYLVHISIMIYLFRILFKLSSNTQFSLI